MKAVIITEYGAPEVLKVSNVPKPVPKNDEILIKVDSTAATASDTVIRKLEAPGNPGVIQAYLLRFLMRLFLGFKKPRNPVLGLVFSGTVVEIGNEITEFKIGDEVYGFAGTSFGGYAQYKCISQKEVANGGLILKPDKMSFEDAAAIIYGGMLAIHFMQPKSIIEDEKVLIYGASGAIGTAAIQLAAAQKADVTAVCSRKNFELVKSLGADKVIDYTDKDARASLETYDLIFDAVGFKKTSALKMELTFSLAKNGRIVSVDDGLLKQKREYLIQLNDAVEAGALKAVIDKTFPLEEIVEAHRYVDSGHKAGNVVIKVANEAT